MRVPLLALALLALPACQRGPSDAEAVDLVRRYDALVADAYRAGDFSVVQPVVGPDELRKIAAHVGVRLDQGITMDARLVEFQPRKVERKKDEIVVTAEERWHYLDRRIGSGEQVGQDSTDHYVMAYYLRKLDKQWVVDRTEFAEPPKVGRTQVPDQAPASVFHGMDARPPGEGK